MHVLLLDVVGMSCAASRCAASSLSLEQAELDSLLQVLILQAEGGQ